MNKFKNETTQVEVLKETEKKTKSGEGEKSFELSEHVKAISSTSTLTIVSTRQSLKGIVKKVLKIEGDFEKQQRQFNYIKSMISGMMLAVGVGTPHIILYLTVDYTYGLWVFVVSVFLFFVHIANMLCYYFLPRKEIIHSLLVHFQNYFTSIITNGLIIFLGVIRFSPSFFIMIIYLSKNYGLNARWKKIYKVYMVVMFLVVLTAEIFRVIFIEFRDKDEFTMRKAEYITVVFLLYGFCGGVLLVLLSHIPRYFGQLTDIIDRIFVLSEGIAKLDFESEDLHKLMKLPDEKCSKVLLCLKDIVKNVKEYKLYLPHRVVEEAKNFNNGSGGSEDTIDDDYSDDGFVVAKKKEKFSHGLSRRCGTVMFIKILNFDELINNDRHFLEFEEVYLEISNFIKEKVDFYKGIVEKAENDMIKCSFNIHKMAVDHEILAVKSGFEIFERIKREYPFFILGICIIKEDYVIVGNIGDKIKLSLSFSKRFLKHAQILSCKNNNNVFICGKVRESVKYETKSFFFERIPYGKSFISIYYLESVLLNQDNVEWLYQIKKEDWGSEDNLFESACCQYFEEDVDSALEKIELYLSKNEGNFCVWKMKKRILLKKKEEFS